MSKAASPCRRCERLRRLQGGGWRGLALWVLLLGALLPARPGVPEAQTVTSAASGALEGTAPPAASAPPSMAPLLPPAGTRPPPASAAQPAPELSVAAQSAASGAVARSTRPVELTYNRLVLVQLHTGQAMKPMALVRGDLTATALEYDPERLPPGLAIDERGVLAGTPLTEGRYDFFLRLAGRSGPGSEQQYRIVVRGPAGPPRPPPMTTISDEAALQTPDLPATTMRSWRLDAEDVETLLQPPEDPTPDDSTAPPAPEPPGLPTPEQLAEMLQPLQDMEFPTEELLRLALRDRVCEIYLERVQALSTERNRPADTSCPPRGADASAASAGTAPAGERSLAQFHRDLMSSALTDEIVALARKAHTIPPPARLALQTRRPADGSAARAGCGCVAATPTDEVYGVIGHWHADAAEPAASGAGAPPQTLGMGLFTRITYLGATLEDDGRITTAYGGDARMLEFARQAQRHGTRVDLGLFRRDWTHLRRIAARGDEAFTEHVNRAASEAVRLLDLNFQDGTRTLHGLLLPAWRETDYAFGGLTVFFDGSTLPTDDSPAAGETRTLHARFVRDFLFAVMAVMRQQPLATAAQAASASVGAASASAGSAANGPRLQPAPRPYRLNIVMPEQQVAAPGPYGLKALWQVYREAERVLTAGQVDDRRKVLMNERSAAPAQWTDITVQFVVLLGEPTTRSKKALRERIDQSTDVTGADRVALLQSIVPVLLTRRAATETVMEPGTAGQLDDDFAYARWNFGGVGLWPAPFEGVGQGTRVRELLAQTYGGDAREGAAPTVSDLCTWVCPYRIELRLLMQTLLMIGVVSLGLYATSCRVRGWGRPVQIFMLAGGALTTALGLALLSCDPALETLRRGNTVLIAVIVGLFATLAWRALKPKVVLP